MNWDSLIKAVTVQSECLVKLDRRAHKKFGDSIQTMQVKEIYEDRFVGKVVTKDGKTHRMTIKR